MNPMLRMKIKLAAERDAELLTSKSDVETTLGHDAKYLLEQLDLSKNDLIRLERLGLAMKGRYATEGKRTILLKDGSKVGITGPHRIRWIIFKEAIL